MRWFERLATYLGSKGRHKTIPDRETGEPYLERYYVMFKNRPSWFPFNIFLHNFKKSDIDDLHDHPWKFWGTIILKGGYWEHTPEGRFWRGPGFHGFNGPDALHKVELDLEKAPDTWTLFIVGWHVKEWNFQTRYGLINWQEYLNNRKKYT